MLTKGTNLGKELLALVEREITTDGRELMCIVNDVYGMICGQTNVYMNNGNTLSLRMSVYISSGDAKPCTHLVHELSKCALNLFHYVHSHFRSVGNSERLNT